MLDSKEEACNAMHSLDKQDLELCDTQDCLNEQQLEEPHRFSNLDLPNNMQNHMMHKSHEIYPSLKNEVIQLIQAKINRIHFKKVQKMVKDADLKNICDGRYSLKSNQMLDRKLEGI